MSVFFKNKKAHQVVNKHIDGLLPSIKPNARENLRHRLDSITSETYFVHSRLLHVLLGFGVLLVSPTVVLWYQLHYACIEWQILPCCQDVQILYLSF